MGRLGAGLVVQQLEPVDFLCEIDHLPPHIRSQARAASRPLSVSVFAARTLNPTGDSQVTLSGR